jgi:hypothetical protein
MIIELENSEIDKFVFKSKGRVLKLIFTKNGFMIPIFCRLKINAYKKFSFQITIFQFSRE